MSDIPRPVAWTSVTQLRSVTLTGDGLMADASSGWEVPLYTVPPERALPTRRREKAVETLLADGWKWEGEQWVRPGG